MQNFNFKRFFGNNSTNSDSASKNKRKRGRVCRIEQLEEREMLSVSMGDFDAIKSQYEDLNLGNFADYNIIEVGGAGNQAGGANNNFAFSDTGIRAAIARAGQTTQNDIIVVRTTATQNKITLGGTELAININAAQYGSVTIVSLGANNLTIDADQRSRVFNIDENSTVALGGLTITNGRVASFGGGIVNCGILTVTGCTIVGNTATSSITLSSGGGIYSTNTLTITNSTITGNTATSFSVTANGGGIYSISTLTITNSTITGNMASATATSSSASATGDGVFGGTLTIT